MTQARKPSRNELNARIARQSHQIECDTRRIRNALSLIESLQREVAAANATIRQLQEDLNRAGHT